MNERKRVGGVENQIVISEVFRQLQIRANEFMRVNRERRPWFSSQDSSFFVLEFDLKFLVEGFLWEIWLEEGDISLEEVYEKYKMVRDYFVSYKEIDIRLAISGDLLINGKKVPVELTVDQIWEIALSTCRDRSLSNALLVEMDSFRSLWEQEIDSRRTRGIDVSDYILLLRRKFNDALLEHNQLVRRVPHGAKFRFRIAGVDYDYPSERFPKDTKWRMVFGSILD